MTVTVISKPIDPSPLYYVVAFYGDSLTTGMSGNGDSFVDFINEPEWVVINRGVFGEFGATIGGNRLKNASGSLYHVDKVDTVVFFWGTNDFALSSFFPPINQTNIDNWYNLVYNPFTQDMARAARAVLDNNMKAVAVLHPNNTADYEYTVERREELKQFYDTTFPPMGVPVLDLFTNFPYETGHEEDGIHFNDTGNQFIADELKNIFRTL